MAGTTVAAPHSGGCRERIVDVAIQQRADIVAISGDLIDRENRFFEAFGPVERG